MVVPRYPRGATPGFFEEQLRYNGMAADTSLRSLGTGYDNSTNLNFARVMWVRWSDVECRMTDGAESNIFFPSDVFFLTVQLLRQLTQEGCGPVRLKVGLLMMQTCQ
ncbi:Scavenger receptor class B member [Trichuris trichiura]|uniref:Scavenger receptor class B member n=1 Tax=Trichuris trichiura TaxID=36087 RepID=A0A077ZJM8_TRITR|nr:Scavenger receptor class B member [Trichuris trichiura]